MDIFSIPDSDSFGFDQTTDFNTGIDSPPPMIDIDAPPPLIDIGAPPPMIDIGPPPPKNEINLDIDPMSMFDDMDKNLDLMMSGLGIMITFITNYLL